MNSKLLHSNVMPCRFRPLAGYLSCSAVLAAHSCLAYLMYCLVCRPVVDPNGLDHDDGMTAFTVEKSSVVRKPGVYVGGAPAYLMAQVHKDKDAFTVIVSHCLQPHSCVC